MDVVTKEVGNLSDRYAKDGVVRIKGALTPYWLNRLRKAVDEELKRGERYFAYRNMRMQQGIFRDFCMKSEIGRLVADLGRSDWTSLIFDQMFVKEPGTRTRTGWHTDQPYWPIDGSIMTTWIALDEVDEDNGALEFIPGSHAWGMKYRPFITDQEGAFLEYLCRDDPQYSDMPDFEAERCKHTIVHWNLEPGDLLAFDGFIVHSAMGNRTSTRRRRGYAIRFALDRARYDPDQGVAEWLSDKSLAKGAPVRSDFFPVVFSRQSFE